MPDSLEQLKQFVEETLDELRRTTPLKERIKGVSADELLAALSPEIQEELAESMPAKERRKGLSADELLAALSPETRAALIQRLKENGSRGGPGTSHPGQGEGKE